MKIVMRLLSDAIFGNGISIPGGEDISILYDDQGFPYYRGGTFKGVFREALLSYLRWTGVSEKNAEESARELLGSPGEDRTDLGKLIFSDFRIPQAVRSIVYKEIGDEPEIMLDSFTHIRTFTSIDKSGTAERGSLRTARCIDKGVYFEAEIQCEKEKEEIVREVLPMIKWVGTHRSRGFGKVQIEVIKGE